MPDTVHDHLAALAIETPSWGYGDSGTRFATFQQPGRPRDVFERLDDAAEVHRLTGAAGAIALHFPWDQVDDLSALRRHAEELGLRIRSCWSSTSSSSRRSTPPTSPTGAPRC